MTSEKINDEIKESKSSKPINYREIIKDLLREPRIEKKYIKPIVDEIISEGLEIMPKLKIELRDLNNEFLIELFRNKPKRFLEDLREELYNRIKFEEGIIEILEKYSIKSEDLDIIPDSTELELLIPTIKDLSINLTKYKERFCRFIGRYMNIGIDKTIGFNYIEFKCTSCLTEFKKYYLNSIDYRTNKPSFCMNRKCNSKIFEIIDEDSFEIGHFILSDLDFKKTGQGKACYILRNIDYFLEKIRTINLCEEVQILGIPHIKYSELTTRRETQRFDYYIEVFDIEPKKIKIFDKSIIKKLGEKLELDNSYFEKLIDAIDALTYFIDIYYPIKLLNCMTFVSGGSWNFKDNIRNTLNGIIAGPKSTYKSSIVRRLESAIGSRHFLVYEVNKEMTKAGLIGTTQRDSNKIVPIIRYGILPIYSNGTIIFDESQNITMNSLDTLRCLEKGDIAGLQDGVHFEGATLESIVLIQNLVLNKDGSYNAYENLFKNLGWDDRGSESRLERFDLLYIIPIPDTFIKLRTLRNEERLSKGILLEEIARDLGLEDYIFPKEIKTYRDKIRYLHFHYLHKAKELYKGVSISEDYKDILRNLYKNVLTNKEDKFKTDTDVNIRSLNICYKILKSLASLRFKEKVEKTSFNYFKKRCMRLIIPFRESELIKTKTIDMNEVFKETFMKEISSKEEITIKEFIDSIKAYIKRTYYNDVSDELFGDEINDYIDSGNTLEDNYEFRKLLKNNEDWLKKQDFFIDSKRGRGKLTVIRKLQQDNEILRTNDNSDIKKDKNKKLTSGDLTNFLDHYFDDYSDIKQVQNVFIRIKEIFEENKYENLEIKSMDQILGLESISKTLLQKAINVFFNIGILIDIGRNLCNMDKKWR